MSEVIPREEWRRYQATPVKKLRLEGLLESAGQDRVVVGTDIAKEDMFAAFEVESGAVVTVRWKHPDETLMFVEVLRAPGPVFADLAEQSVLDGIPLGGARRVVGNRDGESVACAELTVQCLGARLVSAGCTLSGFSGNWSLQ